jgi:amino acid adenylation domain-containing protein
LLRDGTVARLSQHWVELLERAAKRPEASLSEFTMMTDDERALVLSLNAGTRVDYPNLCLHELVSRQAALRPDVEAVVFGTTRLTYRLLEERSNKVAQFLVKQGICSGDRVGIFMDRSADMIVSMLGILKAGGAYVPIDPAYPQERLKFITDDTSVRWVLTEQQVRTVLPSNVPLVSVDGPASPVRACSREHVENRSTPESVAAIIYTSGSTGQPKGACVPHRAVVRTVCNTNYVCATAEDRVAQVASPSFDAALMEIWLALVNGGTLVGIRRETLLDPVALPAVLHTERISIVVLNTAYLHQIGREAPAVLAGVRKILFGGEAAEPGPMRNLLKHVAPGALVNGYGPAEGCVITTYYEIKELPENAVTVPIGRPVSNAQVYLLDEHANLVPVGMVGEIYIGGEGVALGYWNRPELTTQRFIPDPFSGIPGKLLYRTGDLARMRANGELEFVGRMDEQIKIRGHRIELAEVRQAIVSHPGVEQVYLMVREDQVGDKRLVCYVTLRRPLPSAQEELRQHVRAKLPAHMQPAAYVILDSLPINTNGKVDRRALPAPSERPILANDFESAQSGIERKLTGIWQELLRIDHVGLHDNFFDLGGHSLLAARLIGKIESETGQNIPVATLFEAPTIAQLADKLRKCSFTSGWLPLVELHIPEQNAEAKAPLFCVHSLGANLVSFHRLASLLRGDRPVYGLQPHGLDGQQRALDSIEEMAEAYIQEIRTKQTHGPYHLSGVCLGGVLAYEMAQQLCAVGEEVALVALIDSFVPGELRLLHERSSLTEYLDRHLGETLLRRGAARLKYLAKWAANGGVLLSRALGWQEDSSLARATRRVAEANTRAIMAYKPNPYAGKLVQFMCSDGAYRSYEDRRLAWSTLATEGLEVHVVPGDHLTMVEEPNVRTLAQELQHCLDRVSGVSDSRLQKAEELHSPKSAGATQVHVSIPVLTSVGDFSRAPGL